MTTPMKQRATPIKQRATPIKQRATPLKQNAQKEESEEGITGEYSYDACWRRFWFQELYCRLRILIKSLSLSLQLPSVCVR
jgi:hypothetical protein